MRRHMKAAYTTGLLEFAECPKHSAKGIKHSANGSPNVTLGEQHSPKKVTAKPTLPSVFYRALGKAKLKPKKTRKNGNFYPKKMEFFFVDGGPHQPASTHLRHFSREFHGYVADAIRTRDLSLCTYLLYHYTTLSLVSGFHFSSQYIILNRV